ncbi:carbohydrate ABC transporter permease [Homoserinibacter sp. GY 40078]|uniref:carbohydrate ABC transporter permease n=1 Tax=Homoserinibacter sp. GY 40078 TaxID=2603275 RepID=UPI0011C90C22|nr:carbohydrate ABC transporter permease [Homoserinibacter sp. GY 40078]TXK18493.1 carbohydrate ABC transporter permease [Homoserinibacter sp. GY 40078]
MTTISRTPAPRRIDWGSPFVYFVALVCVAVTIAPVVYLILGGFRTTGQINADPSAWPDPWVIDNYVSVLVSSNFWVQLTNSTITAFVTTAGVILLGVMAAFVIARYSFRGRDALFTLFTAGLLFPLTVAVVPLFTMIKGLGLLGELGGIIIPQVAFALPTTIIILVPFLRAIPVELEDAATIDGAGRFGFFWRIVLPLAGPGLVTVGVLAFVASWNAYLLPLLILGDPSSATLPLGTQAFATQYSSDTAKVMAFTTISMIPALVFFTLAQRRIVSGLTGAVKG